MWRRIACQHSRNAEVVLRNSVRPKSRNLLGHRSNVFDRQYFFYNNTKCFCFTTIKSGEINTLPTATSSSDSTECASPASPNLVVPNSRTAKAIATTKTSLTKSYLELGKARLSALVVTTTAAGFGAAGPAALSDPTVLIAALTGTALCSMSASAVNQLLEVDRDRQMKRTQPRPLVTGALSLPHAALVAGTWGTLGPLLLWYGTDPLTTALGLTNMFLYTCVYTPMKPVTTLNTWVGAVVGAIPPVMGYTAASAVVASSAPTWTWLMTDPIAMTLGATLYLWQLPHFMALSYMYRQDYLRGGFVMVPTAYATKSSKDAAEEAAAMQTAQVIVRYAWYLSMVPIAATLLDITSSMYALEGCLLNAYALRVAYRFQDQRTNQNARHIFLTSLWYLPCTLMLFLLHSKTWDATVDETHETSHPNALSQFLSTTIHQIRQRGRELCVHEQATLQGSTARQACPVVVGTEQTVETVQQASQVLTEVTESTAALNETTLSSSSNRE